MKTCIYALLLIIVSAGSSSAYQSQIHCELDGPPTMSPPQLTFDFESGFYFDYYYLIDPCGNWTFYGRTGPVYPD